MKQICIKFLTIILVINYLLACGKPDALITDYLNSSELSENAQEIRTVSPMSPEEASVGAFLEVESSSLCPMPDFTPTKITHDEDEPGVKAIDHDQELKDVGTQFVVGQFFTTKDTLFNFMKLVYGNIDEALKDYREKLGLEERAVFLIFKGGNVLRMVANEVFEIVPPEAREFLKSKYAESFKRSDADFSVYVDETKLSGLDYDRVFAEINELVLRELNKIRQEFYKNPQQYFNFFRLNSNFASQQMKKYFDQLKDLEAVKDEENPTWFDAKFHQFQLLNDRANSEPKCAYHGQYDFRILPEEGKIVQWKISQKPSWITNSDNRAIEGTWGSDPSKIVKFFLSRSKITFEVFYTKDGIIKRKPIGGELIDVSLPHRHDDRLRAFLDNYDKNIANYTLISEDRKEQFTMKSYSLLNLAEDLQFILFDSFLRPWEDKKYEKRLKRLFFLYIIEMLGKLGLGSSEIIKYVDDVKEKILKPLDTLYPINEASQGIADLVKTNVEQIKETWKNLGVVNEFWHAVIEIIHNRLLKSPLENDQTGFLDFLAAIRQNLDNMERLARMSPIIINPEKVYNVEIENLQ